MQKNKNGFTLVEIMIVVAIIGLLTVLGLPGIIKAREVARKNTCKSHMRIIADAIQQYTLEMNIPANTNISLYNDVIMPSSNIRDSSLYISSYLVCPEANATYGGPVNNTNLNVICPVIVPGKSHGTFGEIAN